MKRHVAATAGLAAVMLLGGGTAAEAATRSSSLIDNVKAAVKASATTSSSTSNGVLEMAQQALRDAAAAKAADTASPEQILLDGSSASEVGPDPLCEAAREIDGADGACASELTTTTSAADVVDPSEIDPADLGLTSADGTPLAVAVSAGTVYYKSWSQTYRGRYYIPWMEKHSGRFYYNGSRVWSTTKTLGLKGTHVCNQGYGVGYSIKVTGCKTDVLSTAKLQEWDYFQAHVMWKGFPIYQSHNMHATLTKNGGAS